MTNLPDIPSETKAVIAGIGAIVGEIGTIVAAAVIANKDEQRKKVCSKMLFSILLPGPAHYKEK